MSKEKLLLVGAGGFGCMAAELAMRQYDCAFADDGRAAGETVCDVPVVGRVCDLSRLREEYGKLVVCVGSNAFRARVYEIARTMEYEFPHAGFAKPMTQFMLGPKWLVAPVTAEDDAVTVELPAGRWTDDLGTVHGAVRLHVLDQRHADELAQASAIGCILIAMQLHEVNRFAGDEPGDKLRLRIDENADRLNLLI